MGTKSVTSERVLTRVGQRAWRASARRPGDFAKLWAGQTISLFGSQVTELALPLTAILTLRATPGQVGLLNALKFIPFLLVSLVAGVWVDRHTRRSILMLADFGRAVLIGVLPISAALGLLSLWELYAVALLSGILTVVFDVAYLSYLPSLVSREDIAAGNSKLQASASLATVIGPGMAGGLVQWLTAPVALLLDACSYVASGFSVLFIEQRESDHDRGRQSGHLRAEISSGLRLVFREPSLRALAGEAATFNLLEDFVLIVFLLYATRTLHFRPAALGLVFAAGGVGALLGSLTGGRAARVCGLGPALLASMTAACLAPLALLIRGHPGALTVAVLSVSFFVHGAGVAIGNVNVVTLRQVLTPDGLLGRMNASYRLLSYGAIPLGSLLGGVLGGLIGLRPALALGVLAMPSALLWVIFSPVPRLKALPDARRDPEADQTGAEAEQEASGFGGGEG